jgi:hypothetical protein
VAGETSIRFPTHPRTQLAFIREHRRVKLLKGPAYYYAAEKFFGLYQGRPPGFSRWSFNFNLGAEPTPPRDTTRL